MRFPLAVLAAGVLLAGCGSDDPTTPNCVVSAIAITGAPASVAVGANATLTANVTEENCTTVTVTWATSNNTVLSVNQSGQVTGVAAGGPVTITASAGGKSATAQISVTALAVEPVNSVSVSPDSIVVGVGSTFLLSAITRDIDNAILTGRTVTWGSAAGATATVANGLVTGVAPGNTTVTATSETKNGTSKIFVATPRMVFLITADRTPVGTVVPPTGFSFSTVAGTVFGYSQQSVGHYTVLHQDVNRTGVETEAMFTTAYVEEPSGYCTVDGWDQTSTDVSCWSPTGLSRTTLFTFLMVGSATFGGRSAYAWADNGSATTPYAPDYSYRFSSSNLPITVTRTGTGIYTVLFAGQGRTAAADREALMVSGYGETNTECHSGGWATVGADLSATVYCFNPAGGAANSPFTIGLVSQPRIGARLGFADADQPSQTTAYTPANSKVSPTGSVSVTRTGTGTYTVTFDGFARSGSLKESFQVSAVGTSANRCALSFWEAIGSGTGTGTRATVLCGTPAGAAADTRFVIVAVQ